jgi:hypothetical protein
MTGMKRIKKLIAAWLATHEDPAVRIDNAHTNIKNAVNWDNIARRDQAIFDNLFADALDAADAARKVDKEKTEAAS